MRSRMSKDAPLSAWLGGKSVPPLLASDWSGRATATWLQSSSTVSSAASSAAACSIARRRAASPSWLAYAALQAATAVWESGIWEESDTQPTWRQSK